MKFPIYCVRDIHTGFGTPIINTNDFTAIRDFKYRMQSEAIMSANAKDFDFYKIGLYDSHDGSIESNIPELVITGVSACNEV